MNRNEKEFTRAETSLVLKLLQRKEQDAQPQNNNSIDYAHEGWRTLKFVGTN